MKPVGGESGNCASVETVQVHQRALDKDNLLKFGTTAVDQREIGTSPARRTVSQVREGRTRTRCPTYTFVLRQHRQNWPVITSEIESAARYGRRSGIAGNRQLLVNGIDRFHPARILIRHTSALPGGKPTMPRPCERAGEGRSTAPGIPCQSTRKIEYRRRCFDLVSLFYGKIKFP